MRPLKVVCVGGGPAGLYFSVLMRLGCPEAEVTVFEQNPPGTTFGWGVVFWDGLLDRLYRSDRDSADAIAAGAVCWSGQEVRLGGKTAYVGGSGYSIGRRRLLDVLAARATALGVDLRFRHRVDDLSELETADLVVACDGASSLVRRRHAGHFGTRVDQGRNKYLWLGTSKVFDAFTFAFERTRAGWMWFHAYPFDGETSTCIVECSPETWAGLEFDRRGPDASVALLEDVLGAHLDGHPLVNQPGLGRAPWLNFRWVSNRRWRHRNLVLMGDAAHTTHFAIGLGTELAMMDAIALAGRLRQHREIEAALRTYEEERRRALLAPEREARSSARWFEEVDRHADQRPVRFAYSLWARRRRFPWWRYQVHLALQTAGGRALGRWLTRVRRAARRGRRRLRCACAARRRVRPGAGA